MSESPRTSSGPSAKSAATSDQATENIRIIAFAGSNAWPIFVAQEKDFFARNVLRVDLTFTPGSQFQMVGLIEGRFDIAMTAIDNVVAYDEGQVPAPMQSTPDVAAFMGLSNGFLHLVAAPDIKSYQALKGRRVGVDSTTTGYAFALRKVLELHEIGWDEVTIVEAGGVKDRFDALLKKQLDATLVVSPLEVLAGGMGYIDLGSVSALLGAYQGDVAAARRTWMRDHPTAIIGYLRSMQLAVDWLYDPANHDEAIDILGKFVPSSRGPVADAAYKIMVDRKNGLFPNLSIAEEGVATVLRLRSEYSEQRRQLTDPSKYIDLSYYQAVER